MPDINAELVAAFCAKAQLVNVKVQEVGSLSEALTYLVDVCDRKAPTEMLSEEPGAEKGPLGPNKQPTRVTKVLAAPELEGGDFAQLEEACKAKGIKCVNSGLRQYLAGIDVGFSTAMLGIAASGTCMLNTDSEEVRLAGMISEIHVIMLKKSEIYPNLDAIADKLKERMLSQPSTYTSLVTGPSRTADIERVSAVGVHGPLELHILLLEG